MLVKKAIVGGFKSTSRTKSNVVFHVDDQKTKSFTFNPFKDAEPSTKILKNVMQASINDDFLFTEEAQYVEYYDLAQAKTEQVKIRDASSESCQFSRPRESEIYEANDRKIDEVKLAVHCKDSFHIQTATGEMVMKTNDLDMANHNSLRQGYLSADKDGLAVLFFNDLSLHYYQKNVRQWQREEALSQIVQVEIIDPMLVHKSDLDDADEKSMRQMGEEVSIVQVPGRIIQRRLENMQLLINSVSSFFKDSGADIEDTQIAAPSGDVYGFDKTLVFLTKPNKAIAVSSLKGNLLWSRLIKDPVRRMVFDQVEGDASLDVITDKGHLIKIDPVTGAIRMTEPIPPVPQSIEDTEFIVAQGHVKGNPKYHRQAILAVPKYGEGPIVNLKPEIELVSSPSGPSYLT